MRPPIPEPRLSLTPRSFENHPSPLQRIVEPYSIATLSLSPPPCVAAFFFSFSFALALVRLLARRFPLREAENPRALRVRRVAVLQETELRFSDSRSFVRVFLIKPSAPMLVCQVRCTVAC